MKLEHTGLPARHGVGHADSSSQLLRTPVQICHCYTQA